MECKKPFIITAGSSPCFDTWGPADYWNCADWIAWHKALKSQYGQDEANRRFITEFHNAGFLSASYDCRTFNGSFRAYAKEENFYDGLYAL